MVTTFKAPRIDTVMIAEFKQIEGRLLDFLEGAGPFAKGRHMVAGLLQRFHKEAPHVVIVFCQNDLCHGAGLHLYLSLPVCEPSFSVNHGLNRGWVNRR